MPFVYAARVSSNPMKINIRDIQSAVGVAVLYGASIVGLVWAATFNLTRGPAQPSPQETVGGLPVAQSVTTEEAECPCEPCQRRVEEVAALSSP